MKKILNFLCVFALCTGVANAAVRDGNAVSRVGATQKSTGQRAATTVNSERGATRATAPRTTSTTSNVTSRGAARSDTSTASVTSRAATSNVTSRADATTSTGASRTARAASATSNVTSRAATTTRAAAGSPTVSMRGKTVSAVARAAVNRAALDASSDVMSQTRVGAEYEQCKAAYFACMDQFCQLKNDDYRRCSCSNRVLDLADKRQTLTDAGQQLTTFTENLDVVGMSASEAAAMRTASEGELALGADGSASKALLQAIMNSIRGEDATVGGKMSDLNSINISFDATNAFGTADAGQIIATYNGQTLYSAVYPQCRNAVAADCNDASLQRAITAYLMAVEQDCNTVAAAIENTQKQMKSAVREGSAMLDLARVENRKNHNSSDLATCIAEIESAVLSDQVCGAGYRKCLDNGEFIDITTGSPIAGVSNFADLENMLTFAAGVDAADQKLSQISNNRTFVQNFENRVKKFAQPALDKCVEMADDAWAQYLDKALLDIFYAQKAKVSEIKQGCFDFVAACYMNADTALTAAMKELTSNSALVLQPGRIALTTEMCTDYVESCNNMFSGDIIAQYINSIKDEDATTACRAVAAQCFAKFGGTNYENFYYPYSGLNAVGSGNALQWFSLYEITGLKESGCSSGISVKSLNGDKEFCAEYKSECAKQLADIPACNDQNMIEKVFGGMDYVRANIVTTTTTTTTTTAPAGYGRISYKTGLESDEGAKDITVTNVDSAKIDKGEGDTLVSREIRSTGVATEVYNQILDTLTTQCINLAGRFVPVQQIRLNTYNNKDYCRMSIGDKSEYLGNNSGIENLIRSYGVLQGENMCPRDYGLGVDVQSWGACLCWENGGRRSKNGTSTTCMPVVPSSTGNNGKACPATQKFEGILDWGVDNSGWNQKTKKDEQNNDVPVPFGWCTVSWINNSNQVCLFNINGDSNGKKCKPSVTGNLIDNLPAGI